MEEMLTLPSTTPDIGEMLSSSLADEKGNNRHCLLKVISSLNYFVRQGISDRGHEDKKAGNLLHLLMLHSEDDSLA